MLWFLLRGVSLGFTAGVLPGPFQTFIIQTTLAVGWRRAIPVIFAPLIIDVPIIIITTLLLSQFPPDLIAAIQIAGGTFLLWIARGTWGDLRRSTAATLVEAGQALALSRLMGRAVVMNLLSPGPYLFWSTVNAPLLVSALAESVLHGAAFLLGFYGTFLSMLALLVLVIDRVRRLDERMTRALLWATLALLLVFGASLIVRGVGALLA
jgi:threonine/homoserine/homoserine lactone efflux protein